MGEALPHPSFPLFSASFDTIIFFSSFSAQMGLFLYALQNGPKKQRKRTISFKNGFFF
jgi:hypothetical protein